VISQLSTTQWRRMRQRDHTCLSSALDVGPVLINTEDATWKFCRNAGKSSTVEAAKSRKLKPHIKLPLQKPNLAAYFCRFTLRSWRWRQNVLPKHVSGYGWRRWRKLRIAVGAFASTHGISTFTCWSRWASVWQREIIREREMAGLRAPMQPLDGTER
jgi:hypothetical protein